MTRKWTSSQHSIADIRDWNSANTLMLQPNYQRREVWGDAAKVMLIDSILAGIPMPKIFVAQTIKEDRTYRSVIDGQQRITTILDFISNGFVLRPPYTGEYVGLAYKDLPAVVRDDFLLYQIDFNQAAGLSDEELREVYSRVNKYLVPLNRQELRKADFPGDFLTAAETLANAEVFDDAGLFSAAARRRSLDVEFVCELLAAQLEGVGDKKDAIDACCLKYTKWPADQRAGFEKEFVEVRDDILAMLGSPQLLKKSRWRQKADFYSLFVAVLGLRREGYRLPEDLRPVRDDLSMLDRFIAPSSESPLLRSYGIYCVSQANSSSSRKWRSNFLSAVLTGTYCGSMADAFQRETVASLLIEIRYLLDEVGGEDGCSSFPFFTCPGCGRGDADTWDVSKLAVLWPAGTTSYCMSNAQWVHTGCIDKLSDSIVIELADYLSEDEDEEEQFSISGGGEHE